MVQLSDDMDRIMTLTAISDIVPAVLSAIGRATYIKISSYRACVTTESADTPSRPIKAEIISDAFALSSWAEDLVSSCEESRSSFDVQRALILDPENRYARAKLP